MEAAVAAAAAQRTSMHVEPGPVKWSPFAIRYCYTEKNIDLNYCLLINYDTKNIKRNADDFYAF